MFILVDIVYRRARPGDEKGLKELYDDAYGGGYSLTGFTTHESVRALIEQGSYIWYVALSDGNIVGSTVAVPDDWNRSFEMGRSAVKREYRRLEVAKKTAELARDEAIERRYDIGWGSLRNTAMLRVSVNDKMTVVGHTSEHSPSGERETHLICERMTEDAKRRRVVPANSYLYDWFVVERIQDQMELENREGEYPPIDVVGKGANSEISVALRMHLEDNSGTVTGIEGSLPEHMKVVLLADRTEDMELLRGYGFRITAFMPGWYLLGRNRYDCVVMENCCVEPRSEDEKMDTMIREFTKGFSFKKED